MSITSREIVSPRIAQSGLRWLWITLIILLLDRATKMLIQQYFTLYDTLRITPFFNLTLAYNKGAAFSFLNSAPGWQMWIFGGIAIIITGVLLFWLKKIYYSDRWISIALTLIIGGALGNLCDRLCYGHVIDFLQLHIAGYYWPVFNVADSSICVGAFMLVIDAFLKKN